MTKEEAIVELTARGVEFNSEASAKELKDLEEQTRPPKPEDEPVEPIKRESKGKFEIVELSPTKFIIQTKTEKLIGTYEDADPVKAHDKALNALFGMTRWDR